nr:MAG TPA: Terminase large subunit [Caudoviricetes sp.]
MEFFAKTTTKELSQKKKEGLLKWADIIQWGRRSPSQFCELILGVSLLDYQNFCFTNSFDKQFIMWLMSRSAGKSTVVAPFTMTKQMLFPNHQSYILAGTHSQSQDTFMKIVKIMKKQIPSFTGLTDIFSHELITSTSNKDGITFAPSGFKYTLFNGSSVLSLSSDYEHIRGKRADLLVFDESAFMEKELFVTAMPFIAQSNDFKLGGNIDLSTEPMAFPRQALLCSSASDVDTYFYEKYREWSKEMIMGNPNYFVADVNADMILSPTFKGEQYVPLITQDVIDNEMKTNKEKCLREYYCKFSVNSGDNQPIKRSVLMKNTVERLPVFYNDNKDKEKKKRFVIAYDPCQKVDNSAYAIMECIYDKQIGWTGTVVNVGIFYNKETKKPMQIPEQVKHLKEMILRYNGNNPDYECIGWFIDSGSGGGGGLLSDYFLEDWYDKLGKKHRGFIDKEVQSEYTNVFPNAYNCLHLISPSKYKTQMFDALVDYLNLGIFKFVGGYDNKDTMILFKTENGEQVPYTYELSEDEINAYNNISLMYEELINMYQYKGANNSYRYDLAPDKKNKNYYDDRAYVCALCAWGLYLLKKQDTVDRNISEVDFNKAPRCISSIDF